MHKGILYSIRSSQGKSKAEKLQANLMEILAAEVTPIEKNGSCKGKKKYIYRSAFRKGI